MRLPPIPIKLTMPVRLISPQFVKPSGKRNKNDRRDAEAICEAVSRAHKRVVPLKTEDDGEPRHSGHSPRAQPTDSKADRRGQSSARIAAEREIVRASGIATLRRQPPEIMTDTDNKWPMP